MSVCFELFEASHDFSKTAAPLQSHVVWFNLKIYHTMYESNQFVLKQIKLVKLRNCEIAVAANFLQFIF